MAGKMTLNAVLKLTKGQFDKGIQQVKSSLKGLQNTFLSVSAALGAGLGLTAIVKNLKDTATQLSVVKASLENVSESGAAGAQEYGNNLEFVRKIANEYGQDQNVLIQSFAKFRAAAGYAGMELKDIQKIYEATTRAAGAYHLSAEQTQNVMVALEQMISKAKVTSEELRRQLGNNLPGAFGLMTKAAYRAGVLTSDSTGEMEKMMKAGRVLAVDVLPEFANVLNEITTGANFHSLQADLNRLSNAWINFVDSSGFAEAFEKLVRLATNAIDSLSLNFGFLKQQLITIAATIGGGLGFHKLQQFGTASVAQLNKEIAEIKGRITAIQADITQANGTVEHLKNNWAKIGAELTKDYLLENGISAELAEQLMALQSVNSAEAGRVFSLMQTAKLQTFVSAKKKEEIALQTQLNSLTKLSANQGTVLGRAWIGVASAAKMAGAALRAALSSIGIGLLIGAITTVVQQLTEAFKWSKKIKTYVEDTYNEATKVSSEVETQIAKVESLGRSVLDITKSEKDRKGFLNELNEALGLQGDKMLTLASSAEDVNTAIGKWAETLKNNAIQMGMFNKIGDLTAENAEKRARIEAHSRAIDKHAWNSGWRAGQIEKLQKEIDLNNEVIEMLKREADKLNAPAPKYTKPTGGGGEDGLVKGAEGVQKALNKYREELSKLDSQLKRGAIAEDQYTESLTKLNQKTWEEVAGFANMEAQLKKLPQSYRTLANSIQEASMAADMIELLTKAQKEFDEELEKSKDKTDDFFKDYADLAVPVRKLRDTFFDYKKSNTDILGEHLENAEDYRDQLAKLMEQLTALKEKMGEEFPDFMQTSLDNVVERLKVMQTQVGDIRKAANVAQWIEDLKALKKEYAESTYDAVKNGAMSFDRLTSSIESTKRAFKDASEEGAEFSDTMDAITSTISLIFQVIDTVVSLVEGIKKAQEAYEAYNKAKEASAAQAAAAEIAAIEGVNVAELTSADIVAGAGAIKKAALEEVAKAYVKQAAAAAGASVAAAGPIAATAAAAEVIAGMMAAFAGLQAFANGGIVGGNNTTGDRQIVRANSREMILNKTQQGNLMRMINNGTAGGGNVEFKIRGTDLIGAIKNTESKRRG